MTDPEIVSWARACVRVLEDEGIAPSASIGVARMGPVIIAVHGCDDADSVAWRAQYTAEPKGPVYS